MSSKRVRKIFSLKNTLLKKSSDSALSAVQIYNNPLITFKSETFIVFNGYSLDILITCIFQRQNIEYRLYLMKVKVRIKRRIYQKTKYGEHKHWELESA
jgi:hypothetical protein